MTVPRPFSRYRMCSAFVCVSTILSTVTRQNYPAFKMPDGSVPVLEGGSRASTSTEHPDWKSMTIGIPLAMLKKHPTACTRLSSTSQACAGTIYVDGELLDEDFPFGYPQWAATNTWKLNAAYVKNAALYLPTDRSPNKNWRRCPVRHPSNTGLRLGTTIGSAMSCRYSTRDATDVFYLYDRRHHTSKFGKGGHMV